MPAGPPPRQGQQQRPAAGDLSGRTLRGRYRVIRRIGQGAMSEVYLAEDREQQGTAFAIKVLRSHLVHETDFGLRFRAEGSMLARLDHPGIVRVYEYFEEGGAVCMVLAFVGGESLAERIRRGGAMDPAVALPMFKEVLTALDYSHRAGVIHRDVKPSNILIDTEGKTRLCDFGIARQVGRRGLTATGVTLGTPQYMSPEQIQMPQEIDHRSDLYSAGIVLYEMLTGKVPFGSDDTASDFAILQHHVHSEPPDPRALRPNLHPGLVSVLQKALRKDRDRRYQGGNEFRTAIERFEQGEVDGPGIDLDLNLDDDAGQGTVEPASADEGSRRYAVYAHPVQGAVAVKRGFSWPALCFGVFWMLSKRLYLHALLWTVGYVVLVGLAIVFGDGLFVIVPLLAAGVIAVLAAMRGNRWYEESLAQAGYGSLGEVQAPGSDIAVVKATGGGTRR